MVETPWLVYRFKMDITHELINDGERGVENLIDRMCEYGYGREVRRSKKTNQCGQRWTLFEYWFQVDPTYFEDAWPCEFTDSMRADMCHIQSVRMSRKGPDLKRWGHA